MKPDCENCGCKVRISGNENKIMAICTDQKDVHRRVNGMIMRLNVMLGGIVVAVVLLAINLLTK